MPRWIPSSGPSSEVSHHIALPRRWVAVSSRPISAERISPGFVGAALVGVAVVDVGDRAAQRTGFDDLASGLDLGKFGHVTILRRRPSTRRKHVREQLRGDRCWEGYRTIRIPHLEEPHLTTTVTALSAPSAGADFETVELERRDLRANDVRIDITWAGICHCDIHQARNEWGAAIFPITPGHEIVGTVAEVGSEVTAHAGRRHRRRRLLRRLLPGVRGLQATVRSSSATTGVVADLLREGHARRDHLRRLQPAGRRPRPLRRAIPDGVDLAATTPLLCAGITTYAPMKRHNVGQGTKVGVIGMGGLGHVAVKIAAAMGAEVSVLSRTDAKKDDGIAFGATDYFATEDASVFEQLAGRFDLLINTVGDARRPRRLPGPAGSRRHHGRPGCAQRQARASAPSR